MSSQMLVIKKIFVTKVLAANKFGGVESGNKSKSIKLKTRKSESQKLFQFKKLLKNRNLFKFAIKKVGPSFLAFDTITILNQLWLAFTKALILRYFDPKYYIQIEIDISRYAFGGVLNQLTLKTSLNKVFTKADLDQWHSVAFFFKKNHFCRNLIQDLQQ